MAASLNGCAGNGGRPRWRELPALSAQKRRIANYLGAQGIRLAADGRLGGRAHPGARFNRSPLSGLQASNQRAERATLVTNGFVPDHAVREGVSVPGGTPLS